MVTGISGISGLTGGNCTREEAETYRREFADIDGWDGTLPDDRERIAALLRRGAFVTYCSGYGCRTALYVGDDYIHCALGSYCQRCWDDIQTDMRLQREKGHDHA
jgi:hypothetical protein